MRVDEDAAFRTREAAKRAARDSPNILAWGSADLLLDGLFAAERREPLPGRSPTSRASTYRPRVSVPAIKPSFGAGRIDLFLSAETRILHRACCCFDRSWGGPLRRGDLIQQTQ